MKIYKTQKEVNADIKNGVLTIDGDVRFECNISINANIIVIGSIDANDISAHNISARNISAWNISARDISARDISAWDIIASDISFYAFCFAYISIKCTSINGRRKKHQPPICLEGELTIIPDGKIK